MSRAFSRSHGLLTLVLAGCANVAAPTTPEEGRLQAQFAADRERCRAVAERTFSYVDPRNGTAVSERSIKVEADTQRCMLSRGWNDPNYDGWRKGRS